MKKISVFFITLIMICGVCTPVTFAAVSKEYYVATDGSDDNPGTIDRPFATMAKAAGAIRDNFSSLPDGGINVYFRGGRYPVTATTALTSQNSGTASKPITYKPYNNEKVTFFGGKVLDSSLIEDVPQDIKNMIISEDARGKVKMLDLTKQDLTSDELTMLKTEIPMHGYGRANYNPVEIYVNNYALMPARWPNTGWLYVRGTNGNNLIQYNETRPSQWTNALNAANVNQPYCSGYVGSYYADYNIRINSFDLANKQFTLAQNTGITGEGRYYYFNLLEEIDLPGESYLDRVNAKLYFYPPDDSDNPELIMTRFGNNNIASGSSSAMISMNNVSYVTIQGIEFAYGRGDAVTAGNNSKYITVDGCEIHGMRHAVNMDSVTYSGVKNCNIYDLQAGGIVINGGDRATLTQSGNFVTNNYMHDMNRILKSYYYGIRATGVGCSIENNEIFNFPQMIISLDGNEHKVQYNNIHDGLTDPTDMGAVYWGRDPTWLGIKINYNFFANIYNDLGGYGIEAVFIDDGCCGTEVRGNYFYNAGSRGAVKIHSGQYNTVTQNVFVNQNDGAVDIIQWKTPDYTGNRAEGWKLWLQGREAELGFYGHNIPTKLAAVNYTQPPYSTTYPWLATCITDPAPLYTESNIMDHNLIVNSKATPSDVTNLIGQKDNYVTNIDPGFCDMKNMDLRLQPDSIAYTKIPNFGPGPFERMGNTYAVAGEKPVAELLNIGGTPTPGSELQAKFAYNDPGKIKYSYTKYQWYVSNTLNGTYTPIENQQGWTFKIPSDYLGKYVKVEVKPVNYRGVTGTASMSPAVQIMSVAPAVDKSALIDLVVNTKNIYNNAEYGVRDGQYPKSAIDTFSASINQAAGVLNNPASQTNVNSAVNALTAAMNSFLSAAVAGEADILSLVRRADDAVVGVKISNTTGSPKTGVLIISKYSGNAVINTTFKENVTVPAGSADFTVSPDEPVSYGAGEYIKVFFWEDFNANPITPVYIAN